VARFIDRDPGFLFVPAADVARVARETGAIAKARRTIGRRK
jgi:hypothetical protein